MDNKKRLELDGPIIWHETSPLFVKLAKKMEKGEDAYLEIIRSSGGHIDLIETFCDFYVKRFSSHFHTRLRKFAASSAAILFLLGEKRVMHRDSRLIFHGITLSAAGFIGRKLEEKEGDVEISVRHHLFCEEIIKKRSNLPDDEVEFFMRDQKGRGCRVFNAEEALKAGLATEVAIF